MIKITATSFLCLIRKFPKANTISVLTIVLCVSLASPVTYAHVLHSADITVNIGVRDDAKPFSYIDITRKSETILPGYSGYSIEVCRHVLKQMQMIPRYRNLTFKAHAIQATDRFSELGHEGKLFMLCGPDSITSERLLDYRSSYAFFLSGMTYAYLNPRSSKFPKGQYCDNVIGVVRGTTADTDGLADIASQDLLMRFDAALDLEVSNNSARIARTRKELQRLTEKVLEEEQKKFVGTNRWMLLGSLSTNTTRQSEVRLLKEMLSETDPNALSEAINELTKQDNRLAGKINALMDGQHGLINAQTAREFITDECPQGFTSMPVRKYQGHDEGIEAFCKGEVIYYLADYDILKNKTQEIADCDIVMNRFTRSREVYGAYFPKQHYFDADPDPESTAMIDVASFYADFNNLLRIAMQGGQSEIEKIFINEFGMQRKSEELELFFDSFKIDTQ